MPTYLSLRREDEHFLFEAVRILLAKKGYQRRDMTWYSYTPELIRVLRFDPGYKSRARFAIGLALHVLDKVDDPAVGGMTFSVPCRSTHPQLEDCAISVALRRLVENRTHYDELLYFTESSRLQPESIPQILEIISKSALDFLEQFSVLDDVRRFVKTEKFSAFTIRQSAKTMLNI
jgi:hypothetical protein